MKKFVIISHPRSATNWTKDFLSKQTNVSCLNNIFQVGDAWDRLMKDIGMPRYQHDGRILEWLDAYYNRMHELTGDNIIGFELFFPELSAADIQKIERNKNIIKIYLHRKDWLMAAVSWEIAQRTGTWEYDKVRPLGPITVRKSVVADFRDRYVKPVVQRVYSNYPNCFEYSTLFTLIELNRMLVAIGAEPIAEFVNETKYKQNTPDRIKKVTNLQELKNHFYNETDVHGTQSSSPVR